MLELGDRDEARRRRPAPDSSRRPVRRHEVPRRLLGRRRHARRVGRAEGPGRTDPRRAREAAGVRALGADEDGFCAERRKLVGPGHGGRSSTAWPERPEASVRLSRSLRSRERDQVRRVFLRLGARRATPRLRRSEATDAARSRVQLRYRPCLMSLARQAARRAPRSGPRARRSRLRSRRRALRPERARRGAGPLEDLSARRRARAEGPGDGRGGPGRAAARRARRSAGHGRGARGRGLGRRPDPRPHRALGRARRPRARAAPCCS